MKTKSRFFWIYGAKCFSLTITINAEEKKLKHLRHFVCFKYKNNISEDKITEIEKAFIKLEKKIDDIKEFEKGLNNSPEGLNKGLNTAI